MARYIDADLLLTDEKTHTLPIGCGKASGNVVVFVDDIEKLPTADVVPKSEIKKIVAQIAKQEMDSYEAIYKQDVAMEIFEEIERTLDNYHSACCPIGEIETYSYYEVDLGEAIYELKKKYTDCR